MHKIAFAGLGYVGLPLAVEFGRQRPTTGVDLSKEKPAAHEPCTHPTGGLSSEELRAALHLSATAGLRDADFMVLGRPTDCAQPSSSQSSRFL